MDFLTQIDLTSITAPFDPTEVIRQIKESNPEYDNLPAYAALDMALWTLRAKMEKKGIRELMGIPEAKLPPRSYTIAVCEREEMSRRIDHGKANGFSFFKLKMDGQADERMLSDFRVLTDATFAVDANQAWTDVEDAGRFANQLIQAGCVLIEQPFSKVDLIKTRQLAEGISIPIIADEACQTIGDIDRIKESFAGINVKLQKCGGLSPALEMIRYAKGLGLKVLIGCMSESIVGCAAAEALAPLCDWNDLDGSYLIKDVPFRN